MSEINQNKKQQVDFIIRDFEEKDYPAIANIFNSIFPEHPATAEDYIEQNQNRHKKCKHRRWVVVVDDKIIGTGTYTQNEYQYHPNKFKIWAVVRPEYQNLGIGSNLYDLITSALSEFDPLSLITEARDDMPGAVRFLETRGYKEFQQYSEPHLDVASFDFAPYKNLEAKLKSEGITIKTIRELENDPQRNKKLFELDNEIAADIPDEEDFTPLEYNTFEKSCLKASYILPDAYFVAIDGDQFIGLTTLNKFSAAKDLYTGLTGVIRSHRKRGIATCLKVKAIEYAKKHNYAKIGTDNQTTNKPMIDLNNKLGFKKKFDWIFLRKIFREETE